MGAVYVIRCTKCKMELDPGTKENPTVPGGIMSSHYIGITATSIHARLLSHKQSHRTKSCNSIMHRHEITEHNGEVQSYTADCITTERKLLQLCRREALLIEGQCPSLSINNKMEQGRGSLIRLAATR